MSIHDEPGDHKGGPKALDYLLSAEFSTDFITNEDDDVEARLNIVHADFDDIEEDVCRPVPQASRGKRGRPRAGESKPLVVVKRDPNVPATIYDRLTEFGLLKKVTDIVMAKVNMPWRLRDDAVQEVHTYWSTLIAKDEFQRNQLASYAYMAGKHSALTVRRSLGAVVVIPGALFRTGRDTSFMESIGAAVNPRDVDDFKDSVELSVDAVDVILLSKVSETFLEERLSGLQLSGKQKQVVYKALVERKAADDIAEELGMKLIYVERLLNQVTTKLEKKDACPGGVVPVASRASNGRRGSRTRKPALIVTEPTDELQ